jgi:hypothetical protein
VQPDAVAIGIQARNVLESDKPALHEPAQRMRARIRAMLHGGFAMFRDFAAEHGID